MYAIVRFDRYMAGYLTESPQMALQVTKVLWSEEVANAEVQRLNQLKEGQSSIYFVALTRLERRIVPEES